MNIKIDEKYERRLEQLAESTGRSLEAVAEELIIEGLERFRNGGEICLDEAKRIAERIRNLPYEGADEDFSGRDHDKVLYPREP